MYYNFLITSQEFCHEFNFYSDKVIFNNRLTFKNSQKSDCSVRIFRHVIIYSGSSHSMNISDCPQ